MISKGGDSEEGFVTEGTLVRTSFAPFPVGRSVGLVGVTEWQSTNTPVSALFILILIPLKIILIYFQKIPVVIILQETRPCC